MSKIGLKSFIFFILFIVLGRILFPFGDEPDVVVRVPELLEEEHPVFTPYFYLDGILSEINMNVNYICQPKAGVKSMWAEIGSDCNEDTYQIINRILLTFIVTFPLLFLVLFRNFSVKLFTLFKIKDTKNNWNNRFDILAISLLFSGIIYFIGLLSIEQYTLCLSLLLYVFWNKKIPMIVLLSMIMMTDFGNGLVVLFFVVMYYVLHFLYRKMGSRSVYFFMTIMVFLSLFLGFNILIYLQEVPFLASKALAMYELGILGDFNEKYPIVFRPVITLITGIFMTPSGVKVLLLDICYFIAFIYVFFKIKSVKIENKIILEHKLFFLTSITTILFFVFLFPNYSYAKYYMFLVPFILSFIVQVVRKNTLLNFFITMDIIMFVHLILYRL